MKKALLAGAVLLAAPMLVSAQTEEKEWSGSGEAGFALTTGNTKSQNLNVKFNLNKEDVQGKHNLYFNALRNKSESDGNYDTTANRYETGISSGYKFDERSYLVGAARYESDAFSTYEYQWVVSLGYGYTFIKNAQTEFSTEVGPGYRRQDKRPYTVISGEPPMPTIVDPGVDGSIVGRGLISFKHKFNDSTSFSNTTLIEAGSDNTFVQNDAGLSVSMSEKLALKLGYQIRNNSEVNPGTENTDQLLTTNIVFNF